MVSINCPVDVWVYDSNNNLVALIIDGVPQYSSVTGNVIFTVNENGEKIVYLPADGEYTVNVTATGSGTMSYSVNEYSVTGGNVTRLINYHTVPVTSGMNFTGSVPALDEEELTANLPNGSSAAYRLSNNASPAVNLAREEIKGAAVANNYFDITVTANNDGGVILGGGNFLKGSYAQLEAYPESGGSFLGFYSGNSLLSSDEIYRFAVTANRNIEARFVPVTRYAVYLNSGIAGNITSAEGLYTAGTGISVSAEANSGYVFVNWTSSNGGTFANANSLNTVFTVPANDVALTANFASIDGSPIPQLPQPAIGLSLSLTEPVTGNAVLDNLDFDVSILYNDNISDAVLRGGQTMTAEFAALNTSKKIKSVQFILALHDANGRLVDTTRQEVLIAPDMIRDASLNIPIPVNTNGLNLRVMVWDSLVNDAPHTWNIITAQ
jgi:hypothetical protein